MKRILQLCLFLAIGTVGKAQAPEFGPSANGLIYPDPTIRQLKFIVDSLNLKFKSCDLTRVYRAQLQARAHHVSLDSGNIAQALRDMAARIPLDELLRKHPQATVSKELLVTRARYRDYEDQETVSFSSVPTDAEAYDEYELTFTDHLSDYELPLQGRWVYRHYTKTAYSSESVDAFWFTGSLSDPPLPARYGRLIQYADCLIDTTTLVFSPDARSDGGWPGAEKEHQQVEQFMTYVHGATGMPEYDTKAYDRYLQQYDLWDSLRFHRIDSLRQVSDRFDRLLGGAVTSALASGGSSDEFEEYVTRYHAPGVALDLKRNRIVVGGCSRDTRPRRHALNIAKLAAATVRWEVFLRSHLDIMNDRFERVSDGSYAWGARMTYIRELEILDINVPDLLLGITLRISNPSRNHYFGDVGRLGRALSETARPEEMETRMLEMIGDQELDDYNRMLVYYLFLNYNHHLRDKARQHTNKKRLTAAVTTLPPYLAAAIKVK